MPNIFGLSVDQKSGVYQQSTPNDRYTAIICVVYQSPARHNIIHTRCSRQFFKFKSARLPSACVYICLFVYLFIYIVKFTRGDAAVILFERIPNYYRKDNQNVDTFYYNADDVFLSHARPSTNILFIIIIKTKLAAVYTYKYIHTNTRFLSFARLPH